MSRRTARLVDAGFTLVEMMVTLVIGLILASVALPVIVGAVQNYRLNSVIQQSTSLIDLTRYTAIRRNMVLSLQKTVQNGNTVLYIDLNNNGALDAGEPLVMLPGDMQIANQQPLTPPAASMGIGNTMDFAGKISFDYRGLVKFDNGVGPATYFLAIGYTNQAQFGTRAVTVTPMGQTKSWTAPASGSWSGM